MNRATLYQITQDMRPYLLVAMIQTFGDKCASCQQQRSSYVIDHLKYHEDVTMYDFQLLCVDCHKLRTMASNEAWLTKTPHCATCTCYGDQAEPVEGGVIEETADERSAAQKSEGG
jgi:hypothetical protein